MQCLLWGHVCLSQRLTLRGKDLLVWFRTRQPFQCYLSGNCRSCLCYRESGGSPHRDKGGNLWAPLSIQSQSLKSRALYQVCVWFLMLCPSPVTPALGCSGLLVTSSTALPCQEVTQRFVESFLYIPFLSAPSCLPTLGSSRVWHSPGGVAVSAEGLSQFSPGRTLCTFSSAPTIALKIWFQLETSTRSSKVKDPLQSKASSLLLQCYSW